MEKKLTVPEMPAEERPYEKCMEYGPEVLSDAELLAVIIRTGARGERSMELSRKILELPGTGQGILGIRHLSVKDLMKLRGVGKVKAVQIKCVAELSRRIAKSTASSRLRFDNPAAIADYYMEDLRHLEQEHLLLLMLNSKNKLLQEQMISKGSVNASLITPREIFILALRYDAVNIILIHNHPSGDPTPSHADVEMSRRVKEAGNLVGVQLLDHLIIGDQAYVSLKERGML